MNSKSLSLYDDTLLSPFVLLIFFSYILLLQFISRYCFPLVPHNVVAIITLCTTSHSVQFFVAVTLFADK